MREEKTFRVVVFRFETDASTNYTRYMITKNYMPFFPGNQWLELKSIRKTSTGKEYAKKLVAFLNWLDSRKVTYENATNHHVREFLHELVFGNLADEKVLSLQSSVGYSTLTKYVTVITGFYGWLDDMRQTEMLWKKKSVQANCSFLYGQIYSREYRYLIDGYAARLKSSRDYTKWYDKATKELLCRNFNTLRDEAVLRLTFEGFRIDEVLSVTLDSYDAIEQLVQPTRSKGRANARNGENKLRLVALPKKTCEVIDKYIQTERADAESESGKLSQYLFINLNSGKRQGLPMSYHNYLKILKRCATRAGLDAAKIRTHNGRSTKVMEFGYERAVIDSQPFVKCIRGIIRKYDICDENGELWHFTIKQFRKTLAVRLIENGATTVELAYWLGHLCSDTAAKYYAEVRKKKLAELNTEFFRSKFELIMTGEQLENYTQEERRLLYTDFCLGQRRVELGFCVRKVADGPCADRCSLYNCVNCRNLCTGKQYLPYWKGLLQEQEKLLDRLAEVYKSERITDYSEYLEYKQEYRLLESYQSVVNMIEKEGCI